MKLTTLEIVYLLRGMPRIEQSQLTVDLQGILEDDTSRAAGRASYFVRTPVRWANGRAVVCSSTPWSTLFPATVLPFSTPASSRNSGSCLAQRGTALLCRAGDGGPGHPDRQWHRVLRDAGASLRTVLALNDIQHCRTQVKHPQPTALSSASFGP